MLSVRSIKGDYNLIGWWYLNSVLCGRADKVFYASDHNLKDILDWFDRLTVCIGAFRDELLIGVGFVDTTIIFNKEIKRGEVGFGFLPNCNVIQALQAGRLIIDQLTGEYGYTLLLGTTPLLNKEALAFAKRLGFDQYGPIPYTSFYLGELTGTFTSVLTKEKWIQKK